MAPPGVCSFLPSGLWALDPGQGYLWPPATATACTLFPEPWAGRPTGMAKSVGCEGLRCLPQRCPEPLGSLGQSEMGSCASPSISQLPSQMLPSLPHLPSPPRHTPAPPLPFCLMVLPLLSIIKWSLHSASSASEGSSQESVCTSTCGQRLWPSR